MSAASQVNWEDIIRPLRPVSAFAVACSSAHFYSRDAHEERRRGLGWVAIDGPGGPTPCGSW